MSTASPEQAAAIAAAIERFMRDTAPLRIKRDEDPDPWLRAAILEGVTCEPELVFPALEQASGYTSG